MPSKTTRLERFIMGIPHRALQRQAKLLMRLYPSLKEASLEDLEPFLPLAYEVAKQHGIVLPDSLLGTMLLRALMAKLYDCWRRANIPGPTPSKPKRRARGAG